MLLGLDLDHLASVELDDCASMQHSPLVPEVGAANLVTESADSLRVSIGRLCGFNGKLRVDFFFEALERVHLVRKAVFACLCYFGVIKPSFFGQCQVLSPCCFQFGISLWFNESHR